MTRTMLGRRWTELGEKLVELAEALPDDRLDFRPASAARTVAEQLRHVAFWNDHAARSLRGDFPDGAANELPASRYRTKAAIVRALRESVADVADALARENGRLTEAQRDTVVSNLQHAAEHYGQVVVYARLLGVVPPASRDP